HAFQTWPATEVGPLHRAAFGPGSAARQGQALAGKERQDTRTPMDILNLRRIDCGASAAAEQLTTLRQQLSLQGEVVSPRGRELTVKVFGEALPPVRVVERICAE